MCWWLLAAALLAWGLLIWAVLVLSADADRAAQAQADAAREQATAAQRHWRCFVNGEEED